jgi:hypothetical protein
VRVARFAVAESLTLGTVVMDKSELITSLCGEGNWTQQAVSNMSKPENTVRPSPPEDHSATSVSWPDFLASHPPDKQALEYLNHGRKHSRIRYAR